MYLGKENWIWMCETLTKHVIFTPFANYRRKTFHFWLKPYMSESNAVKSCVCTPSLWIQLTALF